MDRESDEVRWRISSYSAHGECVQVGETADGRIAVRNSNDPDGATVVFTRGEMRAWIRGCRDGEFDDLGS
jgi:hypothetical protein